jgi:hypothetical protein
VRPLFDVLGAKSKKVPEDPAPFEPMAAATRGKTGEQRRNLTADEKKIKHRLVRKAVSTGTFKIESYVGGSGVTRYTLFYMGGPDSAGYGVWEPVKDFDSEADAQAFIDSPPEWWGQTTGAKTAAEDLRRELDQSGWFWSVTEMPDGYHWNLWADRSTNSPAANGVAQTLAEVQSAARAAAGLPPKEGSMDKIAAKIVSRRPLGAGEHHSECEQGDKGCEELTLIGKSGDTDTARTCVLYEIADAVVALDDHGEDTAFDAYDSAMAWAGRIASRKTAASISGLQPGDPVTKIGDPTPYAFVDYDRPKDRVIIADLAGRLQEVSPDVVLRDDGIARQSRLSTASRNSIQDAILGHIGGKS